MLFSEGKSCVSVSGVFLSQLIKGTAMSHEVASTRLLWKLLGRQIIWARAKLGSLHPSPLEQIALSNRPPPIISPTPVKHGLWACYPGYSSFKKLWICLQTVNIQIGRGNKEKNEKNISGEPLSVMVTAVCFSSWPKRPSVCSGTPSWHFHGKPAWVLTCPRAYALSHQGREEPAGWHRNPLGMNCVLVSTLPQAVLPDGRKFERSQL